MNIERLRELQSLLKTIPDANLDLDLWGSITSYDKPQEEAISCGAVCCAVGWSCNHPVFIEQGLHYIQKPIENTEEYNLEPEYNNLTGWSAAEAFFELTQDQAEFIFFEGAYDPYDPITPQNVINQIELLISCNGDVSEFLLD